MAKQSVEDSETSCFEGVVPMSVEFLWKKHVLQNTEEVKRFSKGIAELVQTIVHQILNSSEGRIDFYLALDGQWVS